MHLRLKLANTLSAMLRGGLLVLLHKSHTNQHLRTSGETVHRILLCAPGYLAPQLPTEAPETGETFEAIMQDVDELIIPGAQNLRSRSNLLKDQGSPRVQDDSSSSSCVPFPAGACIRPCLGSWWLGLGLCNACMKSSAR